MSTPQHKNTYGLGCELVYNEFIWFQAGVPGGLVGYPRS